MENSESVTLEDKYSLVKSRAFITGVEALVRLPMLQHQRDLKRGLNTAGFISGYRGSPLGGFDQALWNAQKFLDQNNIKFQPGVNEDLAATAVWGTQQVNLFDDASYDGVFGMWYGKGPGVDRSMDAIRHANSIGTSKFGGVLAIAGDDHAAKSSSLAHQSEHMFIGASIPILNPANVQEVLDLGIYGWEMSRYCGAWVALKAITENMDSAISAEIDLDRVKIVTPEGLEIPAGGLHVRWPDSALDQELRLNKYKLKAACEFARVNNLNKVVLDCEKPRLGIVTTGKSHLDVMQALEDLGIDSNKAAQIGVRIFKAGMSWPLEPVGIQEFARGLEEILVVEEKRSVIEDQLTRQLYNWPTDQRPRIVGKFDEHNKELLPNQAELTPGIVARAIINRISLFHQFSNGDRIEQRLEFYEQKERLISAPGASVDRLPHFCSGCPHSQSTRIPEGSRALGGIGCHYMGLWGEGDRETVTFTHMGGEGASWVGQSAFSETKHVFQNLGDGTYFHSGILAIRQAVAAGVNITYKILYNDAVAMTGGQSVDGALSIAQLIKQLQSEGITRIALVSDDPSPHKNLPRFTGFSLDHRDELLTIEKELREISGTTILIYEQICAAEKRRRRRAGILEDPAKRIFINPEVCEGCGDCSIESNCLSVIPLETELGRKRQIDQSSCNKDFSCVRGFCPSFVTVTGGALKKSHALMKVSDFPELPLPELASVEERPWNIVVAGVGGTGVLTFASIIAMAAHLEGKGCITMNQTGLAQKFGGVVSHVRIAKNQSDINAVRVAAGSTDLLIGCDLSVASGGETVAKLDSSRSHAVVNNFAAGTAEAISNPELVTPLQEMRNFIESETIPGKVNFLQATQLATKLMGDTIASNMFLLGFAQQKGLLPVSVSAMREAIKLNPVAVAFNLEAYEWGRHAAFDIDRVKQAANLEPPHEPLVKLQDIVADRVARLTDYHSSAYAENFRKRIEKLAKIETERNFQNDSALTIAAAKSLFKLMAYKDEYEVARLFSNGEFQNLIASNFEGDYKIEFHLAPPFLARKDSSGRIKKMKFPAISMVLFRILARLRFLRGTRFDVFAFQAERKEERKTLKEFEALLDSLAEKVTANNYHIAVELVTLHKQIRGYGYIKSKNLAQVKIRQQKLLKEFHSELITVKPIVNTEAYEEVS